MVVGHFSKCFTPRLSFLYEVFLLFVCSQGGRTVGSDEEQTYYRKSECNLDKEHEREVRCLEEAMAMWIQEWNQEADWL